MAYFGGMSLQIWGGVGVVKNSQVQRGTATLDIPLRQQNTEEGLGNMTQESHIDP